MKHVSQILENSFYKDQAERDKFTSSKGMLGRAFYFSFVAMLGLYNAAEDRSKLMRYFKQDKKLKIDDIGDENNNMSLIIKLLDEQGAFKSKTTVNQITRFLVKLKQGQIDYVDKDIVLGWIAKMDRKKFMGTIGKFSKSITKLLKDKDYKLEDFAVDAIEFAKRSKQAAPEFWNVARVTKLKKDFEAPAPKQAPTVGDLIKSKLDDKKAAGDKPKRGRKLKIDSGDTKDGVPFTHDGLLDLVKKYVDSGFNDKILGNNSPSLYISGRIEFPADIPHAEVLDIAMRDALTSRSLKGTDLFNYFIKFDAMKDKKNNILYRLLKVDNKVTTQIKENLLAAVRLQTKYEFNFVDAFKYDTDLDFLYAANVMDHYGFYEGLSFNTLKLYSTEIVLGRVLKDVKYIHYMVENYATYAHKLVVYTSRNAPNAHAIIKAEILSKGYENKITDSTPRALLDLLKVLGIEFTIDVDASIEELYRQWGEGNHNTAGKAASFDLSKLMRTIDNSSTDNSTMHNFIDKFTNIDKLSEYTNKYGLIIPYTLILMELHSQYSALSGAFNSAVGKFVVMYMLDLMDDMIKFNTMYWREVQTRQAYSAYYMVAEIENYMRDRGIKLNDNQTQNVTIVSSLYKYASTHPDLVKPFRADREYMFMYINKAQRMYDHVGTMDDKKLHLVFSYLTRTQQIDTYAKWRAAMKPYMKELSNLAISSKVASFLFNRINIDMADVTNVKIYDINDVSSDYTKTVRLLNINDAEDSQILKTILRGTINNAIKNEYGISTDKQRFYGLKLILSKVTDNIDDSDDAESIKDSLKDLLNELDLSNDVVKKIATDVLQHKLVNGNNNKELLACAELCGEISPDNDLFNDNMDKGDIRSTYMYLIERGNITNMDSEDTEKFLELYHNGNHIIHNIFDPKYIKQIGRRETKEKSKQIISNIVLDNLDTHSDIMDEMYEQLDSYYRNHIRRIIVGKSAVTRAITQGPIEMFSKLSRQQLKSAFAYNDIDLDEIDKQIKVSRKSKKNTFSEWVKSVENDVNSSTVKVVPDPAVEEIQQSQTELDQLTINFQKKYWANKHGSQKFRIKRRFNVNLPSTDFYNTKEEMQRNGNLQQVVPCFHGTGGISASFILRYGFNVQSKSSAIGITGRMLGDGIYFAPSIDKPLQYIGNSGYSRGIGVKGYILRMESLLGKKMGHYKTDWDDEGKPLPGFESAGTGNDNIRSAEYAVRNADKQLRIVEAWEVEIISDSHFRNIAKQTPVTEEHDHMFGINEYLEDMDNKDYIGFQFRDNNVPVTPADNSKCSDVVEFKDATKIKGIEVEQNANGLLVKFPTSGDTIIYDVLYANNMDKDIADIYWSLFPQT